MFSDSKSDKVAYFGVWADGARDRSYLREALRICAAAVERCVEQDLRTCPDTQAALNWLAGNGYRLETETSRSFVAVRDDVPRLVPAGASAGSRPCFPE